MVDELNISNAAVLVQTNTNGYQEVVLWRWTEGAGELCVNDDVFGCSDIILTVDEGLADAANFLGLDKDDFVRFVLDFLGHESESLVEREHFLALVDDF